LVAQAGAQIDALQTQIDEASAGRGTATDDLRAHTEHNIVQLESVAAGLRRRNDALTSARREVEAGVARFKAEADEQIGALMPSRLIG
jgi:hypothetical protein